MNEDRYDVVVAGAGPAGAATARGLARAGCRVLVIERSGLEAPRVGESLAPAVQPLLRELGLWPAFSALGSLPSFGTRSLWGGPEEAHSHIVSPYGCGWHVDRVAFDGMLIEGARAAGAEVRLGVALAGCVREGEWWRVELEGAAAVRAAVVVDATGRAATLARRLGGRRCVRDRLVALAARVQDVDGSSEGYTLVETTAAGWWYSAPLPGRGLVAMLMTDADLSARAGWAAALPAVPVTSARVARGTMGVPWITSAVSQRLERRQAPGPWLAVGDAALAVDPISGSGVVRALRTALHAVRTVRALLAGAGPRALVEYERELDRQWSRYLGERAAVYAAEPRWREQPFWRRRQEEMAEKALPG